MGTSEAGARAVIPAVISEQELTVGLGRIYAAVLRLETGAIRLRLGFAPGVGTVLDAGQVAALRTLLSNALAEMYGARRAP